MGRIGRFEGETFEQARQRDHRDLWHDSEPPHEGHIKRGNSETNDTGRSRYCTSRRAGP